MSRTVPSLLVAALVVLAGCAGGIAGPDASGAKTQSADSGTVNFYVSDERNAIEDFEHLNVTITKVGFKKASADAEGDAEAEGDTEAADNETTTTPESTTTDNTTSDNTTTATTTEAEENESEDEQESGDGEWVEREVSSRTVDLTELQGANATLLGNMSVPTGEYEKVFVYVSDVNGTLKSGEQVNVKLPSQKLHLNKNVEVTANGSVDFVFDITVFEAGKSGKYILKPVASESGTDVEIDEVDEQDDEQETELEATVVGEAKAGENATVKVTKNGEPVENATVKVDGEAVAKTGADGTVTVQVPADAEEVTIEVSTSGESEGEAELELELGEESDEGNETDSTEAELALAADGTFAAGEEVTLYVTDGNGDAVENATVELDGEVLGQTNADGELTFTVPDDVTADSKITVTADGESITVDVSAVAAAN